MIYSFGWTAVIVLFIVMVIMGLVGAGKEIDRLKDRISRLERKIDRLEGNGKEEGKT